MKIITHLTGIIMACITVSTFCADVKKFVALTQAAPTTAAITKPQIPTSNVRHIQMLAATLKSNNSYTTAKSVLDVLNAVRPTTVISINSASYYITNDIDPDLIGPFKQTISDVQIKTIAEALNKSVHNILYINIAKAHFLVAEKNNDSRWNIYQSHEGICSLEQWLSDKPMNTKSVIATVFERMRSARAQTGTYNTNQLSNFIHAIYSNSNKSGTVNITSFPCAPIEEAISMPSPIKPLRTRHNKKRPAPSVAPVALPSVPEATEKMTANTLAIINRLPTYTQPLPPAKKIIYRTEMYFTDKTKLIKPKTANGPEKGIFKKT